MIVYNLLDTAKFRCSEAYTTFEPDWFEPEFRLAFVALHVNVWGLIAVARIEEEAIGAAAQNRGHHSILRRACSPGNVARRTKEERSDAVPEP